jgi:uncharacterized phosphosugar-binding protein
VQTQPAYTHEIMSLLQKLAESQNDVLDAVAHRCAETLENNGLIHLFGSGHSVIPTLEAFPRYGSFVGLNPLNDPRLMWHNVLGPGGVRELLWLERTENYIDKFLAHEPLERGDVIVIYSHSEAPQVRCRIFLSWKDANRAEEDRPEGQGALRAPRA